MTRIDTQHPALPDAAIDLPYRARIMDRTLLAPAVWQVRLELPRAISAAVTPWHFIAGQYVTVGVPQDAQAPMRPYSIASGATRPYLDLHIRDTGHGLSHALATQVDTGSEIALGPAAGAAVPASAQNRPLLLLAGGVGIAPMVSILDDRKTDAPPCHLYWAVEHADDLYLDATWKIRANEGHLAGYHALTADDTPGLRQGMVGPAVIADLPDLSDFAIYLAGPAAMVAATLPLLVSHGAQKEYIFGDGITL